MAKLSTKKESEAANLRQDLKNFNDLSVQCECDPETIKQVFVEFKMSEISLKSNYFLAPVVFAVEYVAKGSRLFLCTSRQHFVHYFMQIRQDPFYSAQLFSKTWDEILLDTLPVHVYLDLDLYFGANSNLNAEMLAKSTWCNFWNFLQQKFPDCKPSRVVLNATTEKKFSQHWFIHGIPHLENASHAGKLVHEFVNLYSDSLKIYSEQGIFTSFVDPSVYGVGANFRMLGSPKFGRENVLKLVEQDKENHEFEFHRNCESCAKKLLDSMATCPNEKNVKFWTILQEMDLPWGPEGKFFDDNQKFGLYSHLVPLFNICESVKNAENMKLMKSVAGFELFLSIHSLISNYQTFLTDSQPELCSEENLKRYRSLIGQLEVWTNEIKSGSQDFNEIQFCTAQVCESLFDLNEVGSRFECENLPNMEVNLKIGQQPSKNVRRTLSRIHQTLKQLISADSDETKAMLQERYSAVLVKLPANLQEDFPKILNSEIEILAKIDQLNLDAESVRISRAESARSRICFLMKIHIRQISTEARTYCLTAEFPEIQQQASRILKSSSEQLEELANLHKVIQIESALKQFPECSLKEIGGNLKAWYEMTEGKPEDQENFVVNSLLPLFCA